jgi:hypothetical protein
MKELTQSELAVQDAIRVAYQADDTFTAALAKHGANRWETCVIPEVVAARQAYHQAADAMNKAFSACRASGSIYPILS